MEGKGRDHPANQSVAGGSDFTQTVTVGNTGTIDAANPKLVLDLAGGETVQSLPGSVSCHQVGTQIDCSAASIPAGSSKTLTFGFVAPTVATTHTYTNDATLTTTSSGSNSPVSASAKYTVRGGTVSPPSLQTTYITPATQTVTAGSGPDNAIQTLHLANTGGTNATGVVAKYTIAGAESYDGILASPNGITCSVNAMGTQLTCKPTGKVLPANTSESVTLSFTVPSPNTHQTFTNTATVTANNAATATASAKVTVKITKGGGGGGGGLSARSCARGSVEITGTHVGDINFDGGSLCLFDAEEQGNLLFNGTGTLQVLNSTVEDGGQVDANGAKGVIVCDTATAKGVKIHATHGPVIVGMTNPSYCDGNTVDGSLSINHGTGLVKVGHSTVVGNTELVDNNATGHSIQVDANQVDGNLTCSGDTPAPAGSDNEVLGTNNCPSVR
ncbi:MAG: hypothetical protein ACRDX8_11635 [Acidimicrobiales bacterium]